ncbi:unnamed protein product, partial [Rotaria socialis]
MATEKFSATTNDKRKHDNNKGTLYVDPESDSDKGPYYTIHHDNLLKEFDEITGTKPDKILWIA